LSDEAKTETNDECETLRVSETLAAKVFEVRANFWINVFMMHYREELSDTPKSMTAAAKKADLAAKLFDRSLSDEWN